MAGTALPALLPGPWRLVTGQNPASAIGVAEQIVTVLAQAS